MLNVIWNKCKGDTWCSFTGLRLETVTPVSGVYLIWYQGNPGRIVRVGQGDVTDRIQAHRQDPKVMQYKHHGLLVTWASVRAEYLDGVERYLGETWNPLVGSRFPAAAPIAVNSPFA